MSKCTDPLLFTINNHQQSLQFYLATSLNLLIVLGTDWFSLSMHIFIGTEEPNIWFYGKQHVCFIWPHAYPAHHPATVTSYYIVGQINGFWNMPLGRDFLGDWGYFSIVLKKNRTHMCVGAYDLWLSGISKFLNRGLDQLLTLWLNDKTSLV